jgi:hypothetical protein
MKTVDLAYEILKESKEFNLKSLDEQGEICVAVAEAIDEDPEYEIFLRRIIQNF